MTPDRPHEEHIIDADRRAELVRISIQMYGVGGAESPNAGSDKHVAELEHDFAHLPTSSLSDAADLLDRSKWDIYSLDALDLLMEPQNGAYRIELFKRLAGFSNDFLTPFALKEFFKKTDGTDSFDVSAFGDNEESDHLIWAATSILVAGRLYNMLNEADIGYLREPVDAARALVKGSNEGDAAAIRDIIRVRRVYKVEDIKLLMTGGAPLREGAL